jgi:hypothetical protein
MLFQDLRHTICSYYIEDANAIILCMCTHTHTHVIIYRIAENFLLARFLIWRFGEFGIGCQIKNSPIELNARMPMAVSIHITKFKLRQYRLRAIPPNLMLAKGLPAIRYKARYFSILTLFLCVYMTLCMCQLHYNVIIQVLQTEHKTVSITV